MRLTQRVIKRRRGLLVLLFMLIQVGLFIIGQNYSFSTKYRKPSAKVMKNTQFMAITFIFYGW
jgi:hypothetical protein